MEVPNETNFINFIKTIVRYFASGFIFFIVFIYLNEHDGTQWIWTFTTEKINWPIISIMAIFGLIIYAIHTAVIDDIFYKRCLISLKKRKDKEEFWPKKFDNANLDKVMFELTTYRYQRAATKKRKAKAIHSRIDQLLMLLVLLYSSAFSLFVLPIAFFLWYLLTDLNKVCDIKLLQVLCLGIILFKIGYILDKKITIRELYMLKEKE